MSLIAFQKYKQDLPLFIGTNIHPLLKVRNLEFILVLLSLPALPIVKPKLTPQNTMQAKAVVFLNSVPTVLLFCLHLQAALHHLFPTKQIVDF